MFALFHQSFIFREIQRKSQLCGKKQMQELCEDYHSHVANELIWMWAVSSVHVKFIRGHLLFDRRLGHCSTWVVDNTGLAHKFFIMTLKYTGLSGDTPTSSLNCQGRREWMFGWMNLSAFLAPTTKLLSETAFDQWLIWSELLEGEWWAM